MNVRDGYQRVGRQQHHCAGFSLVELMVVVTIIAILVGIGLPLMDSFVKRAEASEAVEHSGRVAKALSGYLSTHNETDIDTLNGYFTPAGRGNLSKDGDPANSLTTLIPHVKLDQDATFTYEINVKVQADRTYWICIKAYRPADPEAYVFYSGRKSKNGEWDGHAFLNRYVDKTITPVAGGNCNAAGEADVYAG